MTIDNINIDATLENATKLIAEDKDLSPATKSILEILVLIIIQFPPTSIHEEPILGIGLSSGDMATKGVESRKATH